LEVSDREFWNSFTTLLSLLLACYKHTLESQKDSGTQTVLPVVGVVADFHSRSLREAVSPVFLTSNSGANSLLSIKLRMEGQASFDGKLNLRFRVGLPPFGVIGIPLKITGTQDNPKVKAGRGSKKDELEETEDKDEEGKEN